MIFFKYRSMGWSSFGKKDTLNLSDILNSVNIKPMQIKIAAWTKCDYKINQVFENKCTHNLQWFATRVMRMRCRLTREMKVCGPSKLVLNGLRWLKFTNVRLGIFQLLRRKVNILENASEVETQTSYFTSLLLLL